MNPRTGTRYRNLQHVGKTLRRSARTVTVLLLLAGAYSFLVTVRPLLPGALENLTWGERRVMGIVAVVTLGGFGLAAWVAGQLVRAAADLIEVVTDGAEAAVDAGYLIETQIAPNLARAAAALERLAEAPQADAPGRAATAVRRAISEGRWGRAEQLLQDLGRDFPHAPDAAALAAELARARQAEADDLIARLDAARAADDADRVIACRDALTRHLRGAALDDLDRRVARWLAGLIQGRARAGPVTPELAALAARVADGFGGTAEGAAVADALPALRRRAGLCPGCGRAVRGGADVCPDCQADHSAPAQSPRPAPRPRGPIPGRTP
jgi:hypothetical protein